MNRHLDLVAALHVGFGFLGLVFGMFVFGLLGTIGLGSGDEKALIILTLIGFAVGVFCVLFSIPGIIGGIGLFRRKGWARILVLILSAIDLLNIPIGTLLGGYSIWVLVQPETEQLLYPNRPPTVPMDRPTQ